MYAIWIKLAYDPARSTLTLLLAKFGGKSVKNPCSRDSSLHPSEKRCRRFIRYNPEYRVTTSKGGGGELLTNYRSPPNTRSASATSHSATASPSPRGDAIAAAWPAHRLP